MDDETRKQIEGATTSVEVALKVLMNMRTGDGQFAAELLDIVHYLSVGLGALNQVLTSRE